MSVSAEPTSAPARSRAATRARLLASGTELFARRGLHGVTTHDIARAAGVASGTFYLHFKDKQSLFREIVFEAVRDLRARLERATEAAPNRSGAVRSRIRALIDFAEENRDLVRVLFGRGHAAADVESDVLDSLASAAENRLRRQLGSGEIRSDLHPAVAARALVAMQARTLAWWIEDPARAPRERLIETLADLQLYGTEPRRAG
jgi:AcrR family transcriptional regulator